MRSLKSSADVLLPFVEPEAKAAKHHYPHFARNTEMLDRSRQAVVVVRRDGHLPNKERHAIRQAEHPEGEARVVARTGWPLLDSVPREHGAPVLANRTGENNKND